MNVLMKDVQFYEKEKQANHTTRFIFKHGVTTMKNRTFLDQLIEFENRMKKNKEYSELDKTLSFALSIFPDDKQYWKLVITKLIHEG